MEDEILQVHPKVMSGIFVTMNNEHSFPNLGKIVEKYISKIDINTASSKDLGYFAIVLQKCQTQSEESM